MADPTYPEQFSTAFPCDAAPVSFPNIVRAMAAFVRTLITERLECFHCHGGFNFSSSTTHANTAFDERAFHNNGLFNIAGGGYPPGNRGLFEFTGVRDDMGKFRAPTLRNIALTAPYMHDGSLATLDDVINFYSAGGRLIETAAAPIRLRAGLFRASRLHPRSALT